MNVHSELTSVTRMPIVLTQRITTLAHVKMATVEMAGPVQVSTTAELIGYLSGMGK